MTAQGARPPATTGAGSKTPILLLGAGELGSNVISSLLKHGDYNVATTPLTLALRPSTLSTSSSISVQREKELLAYRNSQITLLPLDLETSSVSDLATVFRAFDTVIHTSGMTQPAGTQRKITDAVLAAGVRRYMPWQWGVDYDVLGPDAGNGLFAEQCGVRDVLRRQEEQGKATQWLVVSCGIFMSFLFDEVWGVVTTTSTSTSTSTVTNKDKDNTGDPPTTRINLRIRVRVRALGSWNDLITATTAEDIAHVAANLILDNDSPTIQTAWNDNICHIAGQTLTYADLADLIERYCSGEEMQVERELWTREYLQTQMEENPDDKLWQYRCVFGGGRGVAWWSEEEAKQEDIMEGAVRGGNGQGKEGRRMEGVEEWLVRSGKLKIQRTVVR